MHFKYGSSIDRERTVHVNRNRRYCSFPSQAMEHVDHFLGAADGKSRDQNPAAACRCFAHDFRELRPRSVHRLVIAIAIG